MKASKPAVLILMAMLLSSQAFCIERFPPPEFETDYQMPQTQVPDARDSAWEYIDAGVLFAALCLSAVLVYKKRCRKGIFLLMLFSIVYFGFFRKGCICSIGAIGNVSLSLFSSDYVMPIGGIIFFALPLIFALFFGRVFCSSVCPLGAIQDLFVVRPIKIPHGLESSLRIFAYIYLAAAVLFAATGSAFIICRYDPFVGFFRFGGSFNMLVLGGCLLVIGLFVARPYCRFICPYGVILRQLGRLSKKRVAITPDKCINCRLCEDACPFGAIEKPTAQWPQTDFKINKSRLAFMLILLPVIVTALSIAGSKLANPMAKAHARVRLAEQVYRENAGIAAETTDASKAFRQTGEKTADLFAHAESIRGQFRFGGYFFGGFVGLVIGLKLIGLSIQWYRKDYTAHAGGCVACGRCYSYCPVGRSDYKNINFKEASENGD